jgi:hypothetical protein
MKYLKLRYSLIFAVLTLVAIPAGIFIHRVRDGLRGMHAAMTRRTCVNFVKWSSFYAEEILGEYREKHGCFCPCEEYFGPLTPQMLSEMGSETYKYPDLVRPDDDWAIDPYNRDDPATMRRGPRWDVDRGVPMDIEGGNFTYYTDGKTWYLLISRGPDEDLDLTEDIVKLILGESDDVASVLQKMGHREISGGSAYSIVGGDLFRFISRYP